RAACIYGAGMANNWAMIGFLPVFLIAILRAKGYRPFLERSFLTRMACWGLAGLSLYLLLPALQGFSPHGQVDFWTALKANLKSQKEILVYFRRPAFRALLVASLLPVFVLSIRWKSHSVQFGDDTRLGVFLTKTMVHLVHGLVFACSLWLALDPTFSPRHLGLGTPMLVYYYLSALVCGYCGGYFLLFGWARSGANAESFRDGPAPGWRRLRAQLGLRIRRLVPGAAIALVCALPLLLVRRNLTQITVTNGPWLRQFAGNLYTDLPAGKSVVLSEDPAELLLLRAELSG